MDKAVDVVIPVYNGKKTIAQSIASVLAQTLRPETITVVDDGSTDGTGEILKKAAEEAAGILRVVTTKNQGLASARNTGIRAGKAQFVALLDADDLWHPAKLDRQLKLFFESKDPKLGVVYCKYQDIDEQSDPILGALQVFDPSARGDIEAKLSYANIVSGSGSAVLIRRACLNQCGLFDESLMACEDWDLWLRISKKWHFDYVNEELASLRRHSSNMQDDGQRMLLATLAVLDKHIEKTPYPEFLKARAEAALRGAPLRQAFLFLTGSVRSEYSRFVRLQSEMLTHRPQAAAALSRIVAYKMAKRIRGFG